VLFFPTHDLGDRAQRDPRGVEARCRGAPEVVKMQIALLNSAAIFARLKAVPKPFAFHDRRQLLVRMVVARFGICARTSLSPSYSGMMASRLCLLLPVGSVIASSPTCDHARRNRSAE
jgi:hypothetical protein